MISPPSIWNVITESQDKLWRLASWRGRHSVVCPTTQMTPLSLLDRRGNKKSLCWWGKRSRWTAFWNWCSDYWQFIERAFTSNLIFLLARGLLFKFARLDRPMAVQSASAVSFVHFVYQPKLINFSKSGGRKSTATSILTPHYGIFSKSLFLQSSIY